MDFEWDPRKAKENLRKHGVTFAESLTVFGDPLHVTAVDPDRSVTEDRLITIGISVRGRYLMGAHTDRHDRIRIITARPLTPAERRQYEEEIQG